MRLLDLDDDGYLDVVIGNDKAKTRVWTPKSDVGERRFPASTATACHFGVDAGGPALLERQRRRWRMAVDRARRLPTARGRRLPSSATVGCSISTATATAS